MRLYTLLGEELIQYAEDHHVVIRRFGCFPGRNAALGRTSTREELGYMAQPDSNFGLPESCRTMKICLA